MLYLCLYFLSFPNSGNTWLRVLQGHSVFVFHVICFVLIASLTTTIFLVGQEDETKREFEREGHPPLDKKQKRALTSTGPPKPSPCSGHRTRRATWGTWGARDTKRHLDTKDTKRHLGTSGTRDTERASTSATQRKQTMRQ